MTLSQRFDKDRRQANLTPLVERRIPEWIRRKNESGLVPKDMTERVVAA